MTETVTRVFPGENDRVVGGVLIDVGVALLIFSNVFAYWIGAIGFWPTHLSVGGHKYPAYWFFMSGAVCTGLGMLLTRNYRFLLEEAMVYYWVAAIGIIVLGIFNDPDKTWSAMLHAAGAWGGQLGMAWCTYLQMSNGRWYEMWAKHWRELVFITFCGQVLCSLAVVFYDATAVWRALSGVLWNGFTPVKAALINNRLHTSVAWLLFGGGCQQMTLLCFYTLLTVTTTAFTHPWPDC